MKWDIEKVKNELPTVSVLHGCRHYECKVLGRLNPYATVVSFASGQSCEFSWNTIVRALNGNKPLIA